MLKIWGIRGNYRNGRKNVYRNGALYLMNAMECHYTKETYQENPSPSDWYKKATWRIQKWARLLRNVDLVDGKLVDITNDSTIVNDLVRNKMHRFKSLARILIGSPLSISRVKENMVVLSMDGTNRPVFECFSKPSEREAMVVDSLTKVGDFLNISAQQRKVVRLTICPQVTHHKIWSNALEELLNGLSSDLDAFNHQFPSNGIEMVPQIVSSCLKFLNDVIISYDDESSSWMRLAPTKAVDTSESEKWEDVLEMFNDLINCLKWDEGLFLFRPHVTKLEVMKEGLTQIKDVLIDRSITT